MANPAPRPALRKAPDADQHPALADQPVAVVDLTESRPQLKRSPAEPPADFEAPAPSKPEKPEKPKKPKAEKSTKDKKAKKAKKKQNKRLELRTALSKKKRSKARSSAKAKGTSADEALKETLTWLNGR